MKVDRISLFEDRKEKTRKRSKEYKLSSSMSREELIDVLNNMRPTDLIELLAKNDEIIIDKLEKGTQAFENWLSLKEDLIVDEVLSTRQIKENISQLKNYVKNSDIKELFGTDEESENGKQPKKTILDNKQVQELLCEITRNFVRNIKQEFGNILLGFSERLIGLMETLGNPEPADGAFFLVSDNSKLICSAIINAVSEFNEDSPSVIGVEVERSSSDKRSLGLKYGVSTVLINDLMKIFDEEVVANPEEAIELSDADEDILNVTAAINTSDLITVAKSRGTAQDNGYTIYDCFRMQKGGYSSNFNFGMQIVPLSQSSFDVLFYIYLTDDVMKPKTIFKCDNWI